MASVRHPIHVVEAAKLGAHVATLPPAVLRSLYNHPLTDKGLAGFLADWAKTGQQITDMVAADGRSRRGRRAVDAEAVAAFLRAHPRFLADRPELYRVLAPPRAGARRGAGRPHGGDAAGRAGACRRHGRAGRRRAGRRPRRRRHDRAGAGGGAGADRRRRTSAECITAAFPALLAVDAAALCAEAPLPGARTLPPGTVARLLDGRAVAHRSDADEARLLHGEAAALARHDALVRIPGEPAALLALSAREHWTLDPAQGAGALAFLGRARGRRAGAMTLAAAARRGVSGLAGA